MIQEEIAVMKQLVAPNIVQLLEAFQEPTCVYIV